MKEWKSWADQTPEERMAFNKWVAEQSGTDVDWIDKIHWPTVEESVVYMTPTGHEEGRIKHKRMRITYKADKEAK